MCSGIEAATVAWEPLGFKPAWFAEVAPFPNAVLAHHYPHVPNLGDLMDIADRVREGAADAPDILVGGTPCQAFSVAGLRQGLSDPRGALTLKFTELANAIDLSRTQQQKNPSIILWENVPGVLNDETNAFGCFLGALTGERRALQPAGPRWTDAGCVYGSQRTAAWRVLDAQFFGVAQRRKRVFVVATARDDVDPAQILFESQSLRRDFAPGRETFQTSAALVPTRAGATSGFADRDAAPPSIGSLTYCFGGGNTRGPLESAACLTARGHRCDFEVETFAMQAHFLLTQEENTHGMLSDRVVWRVRRLMPLECERLQGFPEHYTRVPYRGEWAADGPRYQAIGNSMAVPCMRWIGQRLATALSR